jgi:galactitol-specific phosphotransferase system IIB component
MLFFLFLAFSFIVASKAINFGFSTDKGDIFIVGELENPENSEISIEEIYEKLFRNIDLIVSIKENAHELNQIHYLDFIDGSDDF